MMTKWKETIGTTINGFLIKDVKRENNHTFVYAECPRCKKDKWIRSDGIKTAISCGCYNADNNYIKAVDITEMRYKYLKAIRPTEKRDKDGRVLWECRCDCGNTVYLDENRFGHVASCGCKLKEMQSKICKKLYAEGRNKINEYVINNTDVRTITRNKLLSTNTSGYTGVVWDKSRNKWVAQIIFKNKRYHLGRYEDKQIAIEARKAAEEHLYGDFLKWYAETYPEKWEKLNKGKY